MNASAARLPLSVRALNGAARASRRLTGESVPLSEATLVDEAVRSTALSDFGAEPFFEPLALLVESLEADAALTWFGRMSARSELLRVLRNRLQLVEWRRLRPEISAVEVRRPLCIVGLPRSGGALLHELLAQDPDNRVPLAWECRAPCPPPRAGARGSDPRIQESERELAWLDGLVPDFAAAGSTRANRAQACVVPLQHSLCSELFHHQYRVTRYQDAMDRCNRAGVYAFHRAQLQHLQWRCPRERWVLESSAHLWGLDHLLDTYPDACVVQVHRDPAEALASFANLTVLLRSLASQRVEPNAVAADWGPRLAHALEHAIQVRDAGAHAKDAFCDVHFGDLIADPMAVVEQIYGHFALPLSGTAADRMRDFSTEHPPGERGAWRQRAAAGGTGSDIERERFQHYIERFGVQRDPEPA